jgi:hypothetical protein
MILCCYAAVNDNGHFSKNKALGNIRALAQKQRHEQNTLYNPYRNISLNQCFGDSKTPVSEWLNVSGWREWE